VGAGILVLLPKRGCVLPDGVRLCPAVGASGAQESVGSRGKR